MFVECHQLNSRAMAERARLPELLGRRGESQAGIISFVCAATTTTGRDPSHGGGGGLESYRRSIVASAAAATTPRRSGNRRSLCLLFRASSTRAHHSCLHTQEQRRRLGSRGSSGRSLYAHILDTQPDIARARAPSSRRASSKSAES